MLIIPFDRAINWRQPPLVTLALILVNILCFVFWQSGEEHALEEAMDYYVASGLLDIEYAGFERHLGRHASERGLPPLQAAREAPSRLYFRMLDDYRFMQLLHDDRIVRPQQPEFADWKRKRSAFDQRLRQVTFLEYGLKTAQPDWQSLLAHMFLHADFSHLFGNMFFLLAVGFLVEAVLGAPLYLLCYLLTGLGSAAFDLLLGGDSFIPGVGASGAIAGLMGMYAALYWLRPVRFFYFVYVYFDYISLPAIVLLPLWMGNEIYQMWSTPDSRVNFLAHLGGLCSGALIAWIIRGHTSRDTDLAGLQDTAHDFEQRLQQAQALNQQQEYKQSLPLLRRLYRDRPDDQRVLYQLYQAECLYPDSEQFHQLSLHILGLQADNPALASLVHETFVSYLKLAKPAPRINGRLACRLIGTFHATGRFRDVERLGLLLARNGGRCPEQQTVFLQMQQRALEKGDGPRARLFATLATSGHVTQTAQSQP